MKECSECVSYDPADGYCVQHGVYVHALDVCDEFRRPKKWLFLMDETRAPDELPWYQE